MSGTRNAGPLPGARTQTPGSAGNVQGNGRYRQAEKLVLADAPWLPLYFSTVHQVVNTAVKGWFDPPMVVPRLRFIEVTR